MWGSQNFKPPLGTINGVVDWMWSRSALIVALCTSTCCCWEVVKVLLKEVAWWPSATMAFHNWWWSLIGNADTSRGGGKWTSGGAGKCDTFCKMEIRCRKRMGNAWKCYRSFWVESNYNGCVKTEGNVQKSLSKPKLALIQQKRTTKWESLIWMRPVIAKTSRYNQIIQTSSVQRLWKTTEAIN